MPPPGAPGHGCGPAQSCLYCAAGSPLWPVRLVHRALCTQHGLLLEHAARSSELVQATAKSFKDPHEVLGVAHDADDNEVKKAYKRLALRLHPDVNKEELAEAKFRALRDAYELLMGKGDPAREKNAPFGGNWEFHDWYWSFSMRQRQRRQSSSTCAHSSAAAQQHRPKVNSQLSNLKSRAKRRQAQRNTPEDTFAGAAEPQASSQEPSPSVEAPTQANHPQVTQHNPPPPRASISTPPHPHHKPLEEDTFASDPSGQRTASTVHSTSHLFDPLNLFNSHSSTFPAHSSLYATMEEEFHELQRRRSWSHADAGHHRPSSPLHQPSINADAGFWSSLTQHISFARRGFLEATINRHNVCMQSATKHVVELFAGVGSNVHAGLSQHFADILHQDKHTHGKPVGSQGSVRDQFPGIGKPVHSHATAVHMHRGEAAQRVASSKAPEDADEEIEAELDDKSHCAQGHSEPSHTQARFVSTEERRSVVRSQLAGLRRKARMHAP